MKSNLGEFVKNNKSFSIAFLVMLVFILVFLVSKAYFSLEEGSRTTFWVTFFASFGVMLLLFFSGKAKKPIDSVNDDHVQLCKKSYQGLLDEEKRCQEELKKHLMWAYGCLIVGWIAIMAGKLSNHPFFHHPVFALPVFTLASLAATRSLDKSSKLDTSIAQCTIEGVKFEDAQQSIRSRYFMSLLKSFEGWGMWQFAFIRISPHLMIIFSFFKSGALDFLASYTAIPIWLVNILPGVVLGSATWFFGKLVCHPYSSLLANLKGASN